MMNYEMQMSDIGLIQNLVVAGVLIIVFVSAYLMIRYTFNNLSDPDQGMGAIITLIIICGVAIILILTLFNIGSDYQNSILHSFCDIGESAKTTAEYNIAYNTSFEGVVLEHASVNHRIIQDCNGTCQTFHIRWLEEVGWRDRKWGAGGSANPATCSGASHPAQRESGIT